MSYKNKMIEKRKQVNVLKRSDNRNPNSYGIPVLYTNMETKA